MTGQSGQSHRGSPVAPSSMRMPPIARPPKRPKRIGVVNVVQNHDLGATIAVEVGRQRPVSHRHGRHGPVQGIQRSWPRDVFPAPSRTPPASESSRAPGQAPCQRSSARTSMTPSPSRSAYWIGPTGVKPRSIAGARAPGRSPGRGRSTSIHRPRPRTAVSAGRRT